MPEFGSRLGSLYDLGFIGVKRYWRPIADLSLSRTTIGKIFSDDFESGNFSNWTTAQSAWSVQSAVKKNGTYAAKGTGTVNRLLEKTFSALTEVVMEMWCQAAETNLQHFPNTNRYEVVMRSTAVFGWFDGAAYQGYTTATSYSANTWYLVRSRHYLSTDRILCDVYIDNALKHSGLRGNANIETSVASLQIYNSDGTNATLYIDDVKIYRNQTITMNELCPGMKFRIRDSTPSVVATSGVADSNGQATLNISALSTRPPYYDLQVLDFDYSTVLFTDTLFQNDVWGGDVYSLV